MVIFDDNRPQQVSLLRRPEEVFGDVVVESGYYVWVHEHYLIRKETWVWLYDGVGLYRAYKTKNARSVIFKPFLHEVGVVRSVGPKEKKEGNHIRFLYPDGSVSADYRTEPDIRKLNELRR